jgi:hypothetical protein
MPKISALDYDTEISTLPLGFWKDEDAAGHTQDILLRDLQHFAVRIPPHLREAADN